MLVTNLDPRFFGYILFLLREIALNTMTEA